MDQEEYKKGAGGSRGAMDSVDATDHGLPVLLPDEPSSEHALDSSVALFIEGEEQEAVEDTPADESTPPSATESEPKEPWQMTQDEFAAKVYYGEKCKTIEYKQTPELNCFWLQR